MSPDATASDHTDDSTAEQAQANAEATGAADAANNDGGAGVPADVESLKRERDDLFDRLARVSAEFQNFQKRVQRDRAKWTQDAVRDVLSGLLSVPDAIDLALGSIDRGSDPKAVKQGVELVRDELRRQLANQGVTPMDISKGTPFDPEKHQAVAVEEVAGLTRDEVSFVARPGYTIGDTVLRPAQVGVRKPAPGGAPPAL